MKRFKLNLTNNPSFNTVLNLTNKTFDGTTIVSGRGATEDQLLVVSNHLDELEQAQEECCNNDWSAAILQNLSDRLDDLEARIEECCNNSGFSGGSTGENTCDGNEITVSFQWTNQNHTEGKATATSQDPNKTINSYWFLVGNRSVGIYYKQKVSDAGDFRWLIDDSGNVSLIQNPSPSGSTSTQMYCLGIVAVDSGGCEGMISMTLPMYNSVGG